MPTFERVEANKPNCYEPNSGQIRVSSTGGKGGGIPTGGYSIDSGLTWQTSE